jgi:hypothetical protein
MYVRQVGESQRRGGKAPMKTKVLLIAGVALLVVATASVAVALQGRNATSSNDLFLEVTTPADESVVTGSQLTVKGNTDPTAVVSVNGVLVEVDLEGEFCTAVALEEGPNCIEVVASDYEGREACEALTVIYVS